MIDQVLAYTLDYREIARRALGSRWDGLSERQRNEFLVLFTPLTNGALIKAEERHVTVSYDSETVAGTDATVVVSPKRSTLEETVERLAYRLCWKCGHWYVYDVVVDGISLADGYRGQFDRLLRRGGFEDLLELMRRKVSTQASR